MARVSRLAAELDAARDWVDTMTARLKEVEARENSHSMASRYDRDDFVINKARKLLRWARSDRDLAYQRWHGARRRRQARRRNNDVGTR